MPEPIGMLYCFSYVKFLYIARFAGSVASE